MSKTKNRRQLRSLFQMRGFQLKYSLYYIGIALTSVALVNGILVFMLTQIINDIGSAPDLGDQIWFVVWASVKSNSWVAWVGAALLAFIFLGWAIFLTSNIAAPVKLLVRHVEALKNGDYNYKTKLRKSDELQPLMVVLNELSEALKNRSPKV